MIDFENNLKSTSDLTEKEKVQCSEIEQALKSKPEQCIELLEKNKDNNILLLNDGMFGTWFHKAAKTGSVCVAEFMLGKGFDINTKIQHQSFPYTALALAAEKNQLEMVKFLVERGATFDTSGVMFSPVMCAIDNYKLPKDDPTREEIIKYLIEKGFDLSVKYPVANVDGFTGAYERALENKLPISSYILEKLEEAVGKDAYKVTNTPWKPQENNHEDNRENNQENNIEKEGNNMSIQNKSDNFLWAKEKTLEFFAKKIEEHFLNDPSTATEEELVVGMSIEACNHEEFGLRVGFQSKKLYATRKIEEGYEEDDEDMKFHDLMYWDYLQDKWEVGEITEFAVNDPKMVELFGSITYHMFDGRKPLPTGRYTEFEESGFVLEHGVLPEEELPADWFEFAMEVASYMTEQFTDKPELTACIPKTKDFFVVPCRNLGSAWEVIPPELATISVKNKEILDQLIAANNH